MLSSPWTTSVRSADQQLSSNADEVFFRPAYATLPSYDSEDELRQKFPSLRYFNLKHDLAEFSQSLFFVIRSKKTDDIHKAIKYGTWTSSPQNNLKIADAFRSRKNHGGDVFFFFTYLYAAGFVGLARLVDVDLKREFPYWGEIGRWIGVMRLEWVYVRDIEFHNVPKLTEISPIDRLPRGLGDLTDGTKLTEYNALELIKMMNQKTEPSFIFKKFPGHDLQEKTLRASVDEIIRTNMMDIYKKKAQKQSEASGFSGHRGDGGAKVPEPVEVVVKKKVTQGELKRLKKQQQQEQGKKEGEGAN